MCSLLLQQLSANSRKEWENKMGLRWNLNVTLNPTLIARGVMNAVLQAMGWGKLLNVPEIYTLERTRSNGIWIQASSQIYCLPNRNLSWVSVKLKLCLFSSHSNCCLIKMSNLISSGCWHTIAMSLTEILVKKFEIYYPFRRTQSKSRWVLLQSFC